MNSNEPCFIYSLEELAASPSIRDGVSAADERATRAREMEWISRLSKDLKLLDAASVAMVFWVRLTVAPVALLRNTHRPSEHPTAASLLR